MPSLYLLQLSGQKGLNSCLEPLALIGLPYTGQVWGHQAELHWDSKQMKIIPQTPTGCWPRRTSAKQPGFFLDREPKVTPGNSFTPSQDAPRPTTSIRKQCRSKKETAAIFAELHRLMRRKHRLHWLQLLLNNSVALCTLFHKGTQCKNRACVNCAPKMAMYTFLLYT